MKDFQNKFLGGYVGIIITKKEDFETLCSWMNEKNLFLADGTPAGNMSYPVDVKKMASFVIYRNDDGYIYWTLLTDIDRQKYTLVDIIAFMNEVVDAETATVEETTVMKLEDIPEFEVKTVTPAKIDSNINTIKDKVIPAIKQYKNTVVTEENYKDIKKLVTRLNSGYKSINDHKMAVKKEASKEVVIFETDVKAILETFKETATHLKTQVESFEEVEREERKQKKTAVIEQLKKALIEQNYLRKEFADQFEYNEAWSNASCTEKKFKEEANAQFNMLIEKQKNYDEAIKTVEQMIATHKLPAGMMVVDRYIQLYKSGKELADIVTLIAQDAEQIKQSLEKEKQQAVEESRETIVKEVQEQQKQEQVEFSETKFKTYTDEKTGEVYARASDALITVTVQDCPDNIPEDKVFKYNYQFEGNYKAIKTFSMFLKILQKINPSFKYKGDMVKE